MKYITAEERERRLAEHEVPFQLDDAVRVAETLEVGRVIGMAMGRALVRINGQDMPSHYLHDELEHAPDPNCQHLNQHRKFGGAILCDDCDENLGNWRTDAQPTFNATISADGTVEVGRRVR